MRLSFPRSLRASKRALSAAARRTPTPLRCEALEDRLVPTTLPPNFFEFNIASGLLQPTSSALAPDGRVFITQQTGAVRIWDPNTFTVLPQPFVTVATTNWFERGLQSMAFDPNFTTNGYVYLYYTEPAAVGAPSFNRVTRWTADPNNPNQALAGSEALIIRMDQLIAGNHNGGGLVFGFDGMLYLTTGENARTQLAQQLSSNLGKVLRIDPYRDDFPGDPMRNYGIPEYNPFIGTPGANEAILARGFRNPFTATIHPYTGAIYVNDVGGAGASRREELNDLYGTNFQNWGGNFAWPFGEGILGNPQYVDPVFAYAPGYGGTNCAVTGGDFYVWYDAASGFPADYQDDHFFPDLCGRWIYRYDYTSNTSTQFATATAANPVDTLAYGPYLMYLTRGTGTNTGALTLVYYFEGLAPGGGSVGTGDIVDVLAGTPATTAPVPQQAAPQQRAEQPVSATLDLIFTGQAEEQPATASRLLQAVSQAEADLWSSIF